MLVKGNLNNIDLIMNYVKKEPSINLFIIGDIEQFGLNEDFLEVYLQYQNNAITACILRYYRNAIVYSHTDNFNTDEIIDLLKTFNFRYLSGKKTVIDKLIPYLDDIDKINECYFCELRDGKDLPKVTLDIKTATVDDLNKIYELSKLVDFASEDFFESAKRRLETKAGRCYFIETDNRAVSTAQTSIEASTSAMIGGVTTHIDYRNQGYATQVVSKLCQDLINENKMPCLFYHNPKAGSIYHRIGFQDIDNWITIKMKNQ